MTDASSFPATAGRRWPAAGLALAIALAAVVEAGAIVVNPKIGAAAAVLPLLALVVVRPGAGLMLAVAAEVLIPQSVTAGWYVAPALAAAGMAVRREALRIRLADVAFLSWAAWVSLSWLTHRELAVTTRDFLIRGLLPLSFYVWGRVSVPSSLVRRVLVVLLGCGTIAAFTVLMEFAARRLIFTSPIGYQWLASGGLPFRPAGIFNTPPTATVSLAMIVLATAGLVRGPHRRLVLACEVVMILALGATLGRAGWIGLAAGTVAISVLLPVGKRRRAAILFALIACAAAFLVIRGPLSHSHALEASVVRSQNTSYRKQLLEVAWPLAIDSPRHILTGRGFLSFLSTSGKHDLHFRSVDPALWLVHGGPHDEYMRAFLEQGLIGLGLLVLWFGATIGAGVRAARRLAPDSDERLFLAGLTAAVIAFCAAAFFHDLSHNRPNLILAALLCGLLVTMTGRPKPA